MTNYKKLYYALKIAIIECYENLEHYLQQAEELYADAQDTKTDLLTPLDFGSSASGNNPPDGLTAAPSEKNRAT